MKITIRLICLISLFAVGYPVSAQPPGVTMDMINTTVPLEEAQEPFMGPYPVEMREGPVDSEMLMLMPSYLEEFPVNDTMPVLVWGNGGCAMDGTRTAEFLATIASHGFLVITTYAAPGGAERQTADHLFRAIDWAEQQNSNEDGPLFGKVDMDNIAAAGQSCGGVLAMKVGTDPRVDTTIVFNSGVSETAGGPAPADGRATIDDLAKLQGPVMFINGGDRDFMKEASRDNFERVEHVPAFYGERIDGGHLATMNHPGGGEFANVLGGWLMYQLKGQERAAGLYVGEDCALCQYDTWVTDSKGLD